MKIKNVVSTPPFFEAGLNNTSSWEPPRITLFFRFEEESSAWLPPLAFDAGVYRSLTHAFLVDLRELDEYVRVMYVYLSMQMQYTITYSKIVYYH